MITQENIARMNEIEAKFYRNWCLLYPDIQPNYHDSNIVKLRKNKGESSSVKAPNYRWDFIWSSEDGTGGVVLEIQGAVWRKSGHSSGKGIIRDCKKNIIAQLSGYMSVQVPSHLALDTIWTSMIREAIALRLPHYQHQNPKETPRTVGGDNRLEVNLLELANGVF